MFHLLKNLIPSRLLTGLFFYFSVIPGTTNNVRISVFVELIMIYALQNIGYFIINSGVEYFANMLFQLFLMNIFNFVHLN